MKIFKAIRDLCSVKKSGILLMQSIRQACRQENRKAWIGVVTVGGVQYEAQLTLKKKEAEKIINTEGDKNGN